MTPTHKLIDREDPRCLYCRNECDIQLDGAAFATPSYNIDMLTCRKCGEKFEIHWLGDIDPTKIVSFIFTCKDLAIAHDYSAGFYIGGHEILWGSKKPQRAAKDALWVEAFDIDFSDKKKLYKRLKTCLVFS